MDGIKATKVFAMIAHGIPKIPMGLRNHLIFAVSHDAPIIGKDSRIQIKEMGRRRIPKDRHTKRPRTNVVINWKGTTTKAIILTKALRILFANTDTSSFRF